MTKLITTALPYPNGDMHLGHIVGNHLPADIYYRFCKAMGEDVIIVGGTDDHGVGIEIAAKKYGTTEEQLTDEFNDKYIKELSALSIDYDIFGKTHSPVHIETAQAFFDQVNKNGYIEKREQIQAYCEDCQQFLPDRYIEGTCPHCKTPGARGDQCEACGRVLDPIDLLDPVCKICGGHNIVQKSTYHYYFLLSKLQKQLRDWIDTKKDTWKKNVLGTAYKWLDEGLEDRAITRDIKWGIDLPGDSSKKMYVWFEAPVGYISFVKQYDKENNTNYMSHTWLDSSSQIVHFLGKDNIVFHTIIWPAMIMAHGGLALPDNVPGNEFLNLENKKFSTSRGHAIWLGEFLEAFDSDLIRYYLTYCIPERRDSNFSWEEFKDKSNELANSLGNLVNRATKFNISKFDGKFSKPTGQYDIIDQAQEIKDSLILKINDFRFREGLEEVLKYIYAVNKFFDENAPWTLVKTDPDKAKDIINATLYTLVNISILLGIFLPKSSDKIQNILGYKELGFDNINNFYTGETQVNDIGILFTKIEDADILPWQEKLR